MNEQEEIRTAYERYDATGRSRLWDPRNCGYARLSRDRDLAITDLLARSLPASGGRLLDVGCGTGHLATLLATLASPVAYHGVDLLEDRIAAAREAVPNGSFIVAEADAMPYANGEFDVAAALTLFSSIPSAALEARIAKEIGRVLRPGGWLIWYDLRYNNPGNAAVHGISRERLGQLFPDWTAEIRSTSVLPPLARRLGRTTRVAYPAFEALPVLRSHLVGRLRCPS